MSSSPGPRYITMYCRPLFPWKLTPFPFSSNIKVGLFFFPFFGCNAVVLMPCYIMRNPGAATCIASKGLVQATPNSPKTVVFRNLMTLSHHFETESLLFHAPSVFFVYKYRDASSCYTHIFNSLDEAHMPSSSSRGSTLTRISSSNPSKNVPTSLPIPTGSALS